MNSNCDLMKLIIADSNIAAACTRVVRNRGAAGIDGIKVRDLPQWLIDHKNELRQSIMDGTYMPLPVRCVLIPKANGKKRKLGIPTVIDRMIQQAISQILLPIYEHRFSDNSYGYRPHRSVQQAVLAVKQYVDSGYRYVVCLDLEKFFDTVNHTILLKVLRRDIKDERVINLINKCLKCGSSFHGQIFTTTIGTPQGGPLSPLLSNVMLNELDRELERRQFHFVRYADDCIILVKNLLKAQRVKYSITKFIELRLRLKVNRAKTTTGFIDGLHYLGYDFVWNRKQTILLIK